MKASPSIVRIASASVVLTFLSACSASADPASAQEEPSIQRDAAASANSEATSDASASDATSPSDARVGDASASDAGGDATALRGDAGLADGSASACAANIPCDPLGNAGCSAAQFCSATYSSPATTACRADSAAASTQFGGQCPCGPGYACFGVVGICYKICDFKRGTPLLDSKGHVIPDATTDNPDCMADPVADTRGYTTCHQVSGNCWGVCDVQVQ